MTTQLEHRDRCGLTIQERINQALTETLTDIGQLDPPTKSALNRLVKKGLLSKGKGGPFPTLKTVYAVAGFNFEADRNHHVNQAMAVCKLERILKLGPYHPMFTAAPDKREKRLRRNQEIREANQRRLATNRRTYTLITEVMSPSK